jgi:hypothetical protein
MPAAATARLDGSAAWRRPPPTPPPPGHRPGWPTPTGCSPRATLPKALCGEPPSPLARTGSHDHQLLRRRVVDADQDRLLVAVAVSAAVRNGWLASAVLSGWCNQGASPDPRAAPGRGVHRHQLALPGALAHAMGMDGQPRGTPSQRVDLAGHPGWIALVVPPPWRRAAPAGGAKRGTARALPAVTSQCFQQERRSSSIGYSGAYRPPAALGGQPSASSRSGTLARGWTPRRGSVPQPGPWQPVPCPQAAGRNCLAVGSSGPSGNPRVSVGAGGWALPPAGVEAR